MGAMILHLLVRGLAEGAVGSVAGLFSSAEQVRGFSGETGQPFSSQAPTQQPGQQQRPALLVAPSLSDAPDAL
jgi:hypothetical protein